MWWLGVLSNVNEEYSQTVITNTLLQSAIRPPKSLMEPLYHSTDITPGYKLDTPLYNCSLQRYLESASPLLGLKHLFFSVPQRFVALFSLHRSGHYRILPRCHMVEAEQ